MTKNYFYQLAAIILCSTLSFAQEVHEKELPMTLEHDMTLTKNTTYVIQDYLHIINGATLHIEEGVKLKNLKHHNVTIVIDGGSKVVASGSYENPITAVNHSMTSEEATIIMKSSHAEDKSVVSNDFKYDTIDHPTLLLNPKPTVNTKINNSLVDNTDLDLEHIEEEETIDY